MGPDIVALDSNWLIIIGSRIVWRVHVRPFLNNLNKTLTNTKDRVQLEIICISTNTEMKTSSIFGTEDIVCMQNMV